MYFSQLTSFFGLHPLLYSSISIGVVALILGKSYFSGGKCKIKRNLKGQVIVITGANTGIGRETVRALAQQNATIILACRNFKRTEPLLKEIQGKYGRDKCQFIPLDLADLESIKNFTLEFNKRFNRLDILLNNAGTIFQINDIQERQETKQGFEFYFITNYLGHFLLTGLLLVTIKKTPQSRIINVSSLIHKGFGRKPEPKFNFDDLMNKENYNADAAYGQSKLANLMFSRELQRRLEKVKCDTKVVSLHPGVVRTEIVAKKMLNSVPLTLIYPIICYFTKNPIQGAQTSIQLCMEEYDKLVGGEYYADCKIASTSEYSKKAEIGEKLFNISEQLIGFKYNM